MHVLVFWLLFNLELLVLCKSLLQLQGLTTEH